MRSVKLNIESLKGVRTNVRFLPTPCNYVLVNCDYNGDYNGDKDVLSKDVSA